MEKDTNLIDIKQIGQKQLGQKYQSLEDLVYESIKNRIVYHELKPGQRIIDAHLAEELGVSRSVVRQTLTILEKEEIVVSIPRRGFYVKEITKKDVEEVYDIRKLLEVFATELAIPNLTDNDIKVVEDVFANAEMRLKNGDAEGTIEADMILHGLLTDKCGNGRLKNMIDKEASMYVFYRIIDLNQPGRVKEVYAEHFNILQAVKKRDIALATELMSKHIENAKKMILDHFDLYTYG